MWVGELKETFGERTRLVHAADEEQGLAQLGEHERMEEAPGGPGVEEPPGAPGKGIRRTQESGSQGEEQR